MNVWDWIRRVFHRHLLTRKLFTTGQDECPCGLVLEAEFLYSIRLEKYQERMLPIMETYRLKANGKVFMEKFSFIPWRTENT